MQQKSSGNAFVQRFTSLSLQLGLKRASQPSLVVSLPPPPRPQTQRDLLSTHSFGLGFVGIGGPSFPGDGDSLPGGGGESGAIWVGLFSSVIGSDCGRGGGGGGSGGCGGAVSVGGLFCSVGWPVMTDPLSLSARPTTESICTRGRDNTLGQISSSLTRNTSAAG